MTTTAAARGAVHPVPRPPGAGRWRARLVDHAPFLVALGLGALVRLVVTAAFPPAMMVSDAPSYLRFLGDLQPSLERPDGYGLLLLLPLSWVADDVALFVGVQHVLGLAAATGLYALLRRWDVGRWWAAVAVLPVLLDAMLLVLEHGPLSDAFFLDLVVLAVVLLGWRARPSPGLALAAGLVMGASVTVRQVGTPLVLAGALFCLLAAAGRWRRVLTAVALVVGFLVPVGAYATWFSGTHGTYGLSGIGGLSAYMRTTTFVECDRLELAPYAEVLCPPEPVGERRDPTDYGWYQIGVGAQSLVVPAGVDRADVLRDVARQAVREQPLDYARIVLRDVALGFDPVRVDRFEYSTAFKWKFSTYVDREPTPWTEPGFAEHGGVQQQTHQPWARVMVAYEDVVYTWGPLVLLCLVVGVFGAVHPRAGAARPLVLLLVLCGFGLSVLPDLTTQFVWRYQLPAVVLLPVAAVLAGSALRRSRAAPSERPGA
ncbi:hypothetical protein [uncultured Pseudokineococcus sp.]|uniref:hypothetical protein n=1 Tax=uncultured Pseudokineococcus sp. TaxID=1642928 RepID=UPI00262D38CE|nr:hypothetical protein [uncultured Pseudokineococcus sp.]